MVLERARNKIEPLALALLRIAVGVIMAVHGYQKLSDPAAFSGLLGSLGIPYPEISAYLAIACELGGGLGLAVGLLTPLAALGIAASMAVAVFHVHFANGLLAKNNGFEYPLTLLIIAVYFIVRGGGRLSLDALFSGCCKKQCESGGACCH